MTYWMSKHVAAYNYSNYTCNLARWQNKLPEDDILNVETCSSLTIHIFIIFSIICAFIGWIINNKECTVHVSKCIYVIQNRQNLIVLKYIFEVIWIEKLLMKFWPQIPLEVSAKVINRRVDVLGKSGAFCISWIFKNIYFPSLLSSCTCRVQVKPN